MFELPDHWAEYLTSQPESGMGYWIVSVRLADGRQFDRVVINGGVVTQVYGHNSVPFDADQITELWVTHDRWQFNR